MSLPMEISDGLIIKDCGKNINVFVARYTIYISRHDLTHVLCMVQKTAQDRIISNQLWLCTSSTLYSELLDVGEVFAGSNFQPHPWFVLT